MYYTVYLGLWELRCDAQYIVASFDSDLAYGPEGPI